MKRKDETSLLTSAAISHTGEIDGDQSHRWSEIKKTMLHINNILFETQMKY